MTHLELIQQECQERWRAEITPSRMTDRDLVLLEKDARRPDYGGKYYKPVVVLSLIDELKRARLFALLLAIATARRGRERMSLADKNRNDILVAAGEAVIRRYRAELDRERPEDICECGDYRRDHPDDGPCNLNGLGHGIPSSEPEAKCLKFRLSPDASGADGANEKQ